MNPKISLMIHTASMDEFLQNQGISSYFNSLLDNLNRQSFPEDFELIYIDTFYEDNKARFEPMYNGLRFQVKHVPIHPDHRYWYDQGYCYISAAKNTGILYADGELLITCDDAEFFPENFLSLYWHHFQMGNLMHALHKRFKTINTHNGQVEYPLNGDVYINDHRFNQVLQQPLKYHNYGSWTYAGTSFALEDALKLNGFNERMDGCKSLEDCEFGSRLALIGKRFVLDAKGFAYIVDHRSYSDVQLNWEENPDEQASAKIVMPTKKKIDNLIAIENYGMLRCSTDIPETEANKHPLTAKHKEIIKAQTLHYRQFDPFAEENKEKMDIWMNTPTFDLRMQRAELRNNNWRW